MRTKTIRVLVAVASTLALTACGLEIVPIPLTAQDLLRTDL